MNRHYVVQPGDTLYSIAMKFNTYVATIALQNQLASPMIYVGQTLLIPSQTLMAGTGERQMTYRPVTAYTATRPIYVNGVDINTGLYPVLNFQPEGAAYPYIYVPIAQFSRVGARVVWDDVNQVMNVTTDYFELKNRVNTLSAENQYLSSLTEELTMQDLGSTAGNSINNGFIAKESDWLYYNKRQGTALYGDLNKMRTDRTMDTLLSSNDDPTYMNVLNGWTYYRNGRDNGRIYKIKIDGTEKTKLTDDSSTNLMVAGDWLYYANQSDGAKLYKINVDGTGRTKLNEDQTSAINIIGNWIYYQNVGDRNTPYRVRTDGTERTKLNDTTTYNLIIHGYWIYFRNPADENRIYRMTMDGSNQTKLSDVPTTVFNISNGWIYYTTVDVPGGDLYKMKLDGTSKTFLNEQFVTNMIIFDEWIYYTRTEKMIYRMRADGTQKQTLY